MTCTITIFKGLMQCKKSTLIKAICSSLSRHLSLQGLVEETSVYLQSNIKKKHISFDFYVDILHHLYVTNLLQFYGFFGSP